MKTIRLDGTIGYEITAANLASQIEGEKEVTLIMNSGGGSILEGFAIYNMLNDFDGKVHVKIDLAASMASVIAMAADTITMRGNSSLMMIHKPWTGIAGDAEDLRSAADTLDKMEGMISRIYLGKAGAKVSKKDLEKMLSDETWMDGAEAVSFGFADSLEKAEKNPMKAMMAAMSAQKDCHYDVSKMAAKIADMEDGRAKLDKILESCNKYSEIEAALRSRFGASQSEATAIVASIKRVQGHQGEPVESAIDAGEITRVFKAFLIGEKHERPISRPD